MPGFNWVAGVKEDNRNGRRRGAGGTHGEVTPGHEDHGDVMADELGDQRW
jgi:hypothetical protein